MHAQLQSIVSDFESVSARLQRLTDSLSDTLWLARPTERGWSAAECVAHLNRTGEEFLPIIRKALGEASPLTAGSTRRFRRDAFGWLLWRIMPPPVRLVRSRTTAQFMPADDLDCGHLVATFQQLQLEQVQCVEAADGLAIDQVFIASPFNERARYNLFSCLSILPRHQHRHLWQAERAIQMAVTH